MSKRPEVQLGGKTYKLGLFSLNVMVRLQKEWKCKLEDLDKLVTKKLENEGMETIRLVVSCLLVDDYPEMTPQKVGSLMTAKNMGAVSEAMAAVFEEEE